MKHVRCFQESKNERGESRDAMQDAAQLELARMRRNGHGNRGRDDGTIQGSSDWLDPWKLQALETSDEKNDAASPWRKKQWNGMLTEKR